LSLKPDTRYPFLLYFPPNTEQAFLGYPGKISSDGLFQNSKPQFVFFPFSSKDAEALILEDFSLNPAGYFIDPNLKFQLKQPTTQKSQFIDFVNLSKSSFNHHFTKVVASRISRYTLHGPVSWELMLPEIRTNFPSACFLVLHIPGHFTWIALSPEKLFSLKGDLLETMALAGTRPHMPGEPRWTEKEYDEQAWVSEDLRKKIQDSGYEQSKESGPDTLFTGQLYHLCSRFIARKTGDSQGIESLLKTFHPTPAVAGYPVSTSVDWIHAHEKHRRDYYSGYFGMIEKGEAEIYVNLRCGVLLGNELQLYTGCGITAGSDPNLEWEETGNKRNTLLQLFKKYNPREQNSI